jgi:cobyrinic acid a,c-diamide synthase
VNATLPAPGLIIAAPSSGSGKTIFTLGLLRALRRAGIGVASAKVGPDYIDPAFHGAASGRPCLNLDGWAMRPSTIAARVSELSQAADLVICEGVMGLFDGADVPAGARAGSTAEVAAETGWPVLLLVDLRGQSASAAALIDGFRRHRDDVTVAGVVFNRCGSPAHHAMVERACRASCPDLPRLGWLPRDASLALPERHLGLVQACETADLEARLERAADVVAQNVDLGRLIALARPSPLAGAAPQSGGVPLRPLGQHIAVARDDAFAFAYPAILEGWRAQGAELSFFSPLADEAPATNADAVYLPGGYPELHAGTLAAAERFLAGLRRHAAAGDWIYGECGGYMTLGRQLEDADGRIHAMAGLLPVTTSFARRRLHLGYRQVVLALDTPFGASGSGLRGHEFHYAAVTWAEPGAPLFSVADAAGRDLGPAGHVAGHVIGSFVHLVDGGCE